MLILLSTSKTKIDEQRHPTYNNSQSKVDKEIFDLLATTIDSELTEAENKIWHAHPVWFLDGNPIAGYKNLKAGIRLMFWSGAGFDEKQIKPGTGKFKDASIICTSIEQINAKYLKRWQESRNDYAKLRTRE